MSGEMWSPARSQGQIAGSGADPGAGPWLGVSCALGAGLPLLPARGIGFCSQVIHRKAQKARVSRTKVRLLDGWHMLLGISWMNVHMYVEAHHPHGGGGSA